MKGNCSPRTEKFLDKDDLKVDYDSFSHHGKKTIEFIKKSIEIILNNHGFYCRP